MSNMQSILIFIDGTICDERHRHHLGIGSPKFHSQQAISKDLPVNGSVECLKRLSTQFNIVYIGARPITTLQFTKEWLDRNDFPSGDAYLAETQEERLKIIQRIKSRYEFFAGIGDRWDDNELHREIGCLSIILKEYVGNWNEVYDKVMVHERKEVIKKNEIHLRGKIEGLVRVLPLLHNVYGKSMWDQFFNSVVKIAENTREERRREDLASFKKLNLDPNDLRDVAKWEEISRENEWRDDEAYGLQDREIIELTTNRYVHKVTRCLYADLWKEHGRPDIGYQIHCRTDFAWLDKPAWNPEVRFERPTTIMEGGDCCVFILHNPISKEEQSVNDS
jgi:hypothetical protein